MDGTAFDRLTRAFTAATTRRRLLALVASTPVGGALTTLLASRSEARRRSDRHRRREYAQRTRQRAEAQDQHKRKKRKKHRCTPESDAQTCAGKCDMATNSCGASVFCGPCGCDGCPICQTCNQTPGVCIPNRSVVGQICGTGQVCQADGSCVCNATSCSGTGMTCGGGGTPGVCGCTPQSDAEACAGKVCGTAINNCGQEVICTGCAGCCDGDQCRDGTIRTRCGRQGVPCRVCDAFATCGATGCEPLPACGSPSNGPCRVFVTSSLHTGNIGSVEDADQICQDRAVEAGLPGLYQAWLSSDAATDKSPANRFVTRELSAYWLVNGTPIAQSWADLTQGSIKAAIRFDENGTQIRGFPSDVWTNTRTDGNRGNDFDPAADFSCRNWTSAICDSTADGVSFIGISTTDTSDWTSVTDSWGCCVARRLYCFQQA